MTQIHTPSFDANINIDNIMRAAEMNLKFMTVSLETKDFEAAETYRHLSRTHNAIANIMIEQALLPIADILHLPSILTRALSFTDSSIRKEIGQAIEFVDVNINTEEGKQKVINKIQGPEERHKVQQFKEGIQRIVEISQLQDVDLFALSKKKEKSILFKVQMKKELSDEDEKLLFAKQVKDSIVEMIRNGGRIEAVDLIQNYAFKYANYSNSEANMLVQAIKEHYKVIEPKSKPSFRYTKEEHLPNNIWLKIEYVIKKKTDLKEARTGLAFAIVNAKLGMMSPYGKKVCEPDDILLYRPVFKYEEKRVLEITNDL